MAYMYRKGLSFAPVEDDGRCLPYVYLNDPIRSSGNIDSLHKVTGGYMFLDPNYPSDSIGFFEIYGDVVVDDVNHTITKDFVTYTYDEVIEQTNSHNPNSIIAFFLQEEPFQDFPGVYGCMVYDVILKKKVIYPFLTLAELNDHYSAYEDYVSLYAWGKNSYIDILGSSTEDFVGSTFSTNGDRGTVPAPIAGNPFSYLQANGRWVSGYRIEDDLQDTICSVVKDVREDIITVQDDIRDDEKEASFCRQAFGWSSLGAIVDVNGQRVFSQADTLINWNITVKLIKDATNPDPNWIVSVLGVGRPILYKIPKGRNIIGVEFLEDYYRVPTEQERDAEYSFKVSYTASDLDDLINDDYWIVFSFGRLLWDERVHCSNEYTIDLSNIDCINDRVTSTAINPSITSYQDFEDKLGFFRSTASYFKVVCRPGAESLSYDATSVHKYGFDYDYRLNDRFFPNKYHIGFDINAEPFKNQDRFIDSNELLEFINPSWDDLYFSRVIYDIKDDISKLNNNAAVKELTGTGDVVENPASDTSYYGFIFYDFVRGTHRVISTGIGATWAGVSTYLGDDERNKTINVISSKDIRFVSGPAAEYHRQLVYCNDYWFNKFKDDRQSDPFIENDACVYIKYPMYELDWQDRPTIAKPSGVGFLVDDKEHVNFTSQNVTPNINGYHITDNFVAKNTITKTITKHEYLELKNSNKLDENVIYVIIRKLDQNGKPLV